MEKRKLIDELVNLRKEAIIRNKQNLEFISFELNEAVKIGTINFFEKCACKLRLISEDVRNFNSDQVATSIKVEKDERNCLFKKVSKLLHKITNAQMSMNDIEMIVYQLDDQQNFMEKYGCLAMFDYESIVSEKLLSQLALVHGVEIMFDQENKTITMSAIVPTVDNLEELETEKVLTHSPVNSNSDNL